MKGTITTLILMLALCGFSQSRNSELMLILDSVVTRAHEISMYSDEVDWSGLRNEMMELGKSARTIEELAPSFELMLNAMRDHHGMVRRTSDYSTLASFTDHANSRKQDDREFETRFWSYVNDPDARFTSALLSDDIGYLNVVGVGGNIDGQAEAERIRSAISDLDKKGVDKWIVDLRFNGGGNVNVMMAGLAPLFDTEEIVSIQGSDGSTHSTARIDNGNFWYYEVNAFPMDSLPKIQNHKVAVLTSRWTWSSGEFVAIAFEGQDNTRHFGEYTGGYTTNNSWEIFNNEIALIISTGVFADRNGKPYPKYLEPDSEVEFQLERKHELDICIQKAIDWLDY